MIRWIEGHVGTTIAYVVGALIIGGVAASIIGWAVGDATVAENGWVISIVAGLIGATIRAGYNVGQRTRFARLEDELATVNRHMERQAEELRGAHEVIVDVYNQLNRDSGGGVVRNLPLKGNRT